MIAPESAIIQEKWIMRLNTFEERLVWARRTHAKLTQRELVEKMKEEYEVSVGANYISVIEIGGDKRPTFEVVRAMAGAMKVSLDWLALFTEDYTIPQNRENDVTYFSPEADEAAQLVDKMRPEQRAVLLNVARSMVSAPTDRQLERAEIRDILDSIERTHGRPVRSEIEKLFRNKGMPID